MKMDGDRAGFQDQHNIDQNIEDAFSCLIYGGLLYYFWSLWEQYGVLMRLSVRSICFVRYVFDYF